MFPSHDPRARREADHVPDCYFTWFRRNSHRWFRKYATLYQALEIGLNNYTKLLWIDSDCVFKSQLTEETICRNFFADDTEREGDLLYLKNRRRVLEAGFVGYNIGCCHIRGYALLKEIFELYQSGKFKRLFRWDDCYTLQKIGLSGRYRSRDLCHGIDRSNHSDVFRYSQLEPFIKHNKGRHGRKLGLMK